MIERYYLKADHEREWSSVTRKQFIAAEQAAGFHSKFGPDHPATSGFSGKGMSGRVDYVTDNNNDAPAAPERGDQPKLIDQLLDAAIYAEDIDKRVAARVRIVKMFDQHSTLITQRERLIDAIRDVAIHSLRYCEQAYDHDNQARLNLEALLESVITTNEQEGIDTIAR